ncbi:MAG: hypothetical protein LBK23_09885 [Oscillospiraceae bacterium]|nr:hypothetical protein [Oscillospiraceae bacterium]
MTEADIVEFPLKYKHGGKVSKLTIIKSGESRDIVNYDRGWEAELTGKGLSLVQIDSPVCD